MLCLDSCCFVKKNGKWHKRLDTPTEKPILAALFDRLPTNQLISDCRSHLTTWIMTKQSKLFAAEEAAKLFGLKFDKAELFKDAARHVNWPVA